MKENLVKERNCFRGNFVNPLTGKVDPKLVRSNRYLLKIIEGEKSFFYHVNDRGDIYSHVWATEPQSFTTTCVRTDWEKLNKKIHKIHTKHSQRNALNTHNCISDKNTNFLNIRNIADLADDLSLSQEIILQLLKEYSFETLKTLKNLKTSNFAALPEVRGFYASNEIQVDEFQIQEYGNFYHVFICQGYRYDEYNHGLRITGSNRFEYFVKTRNTIQKEYKGFQNLKDSYPTLPEWIISELFKGDTSNELYKSMIEKIISVRNSDSHTSSEIMEVMDYFSLSPIRVKSKILSFLQRIGA